MTTCTTLSWELFQCRRADSHTPIGVSSKDHHVRSHEPNSITRLTEPEGDWEASSGMESGNFEFLEEKMTQHCVMD